MSNTPLIPFNRGDMWLFYEDTSGASHNQHWKDLVEQGTLIDPETGDDMTIVGWGTVT